ncbi:hypothetical protein GCM10009602_43150 [Nocardiopsis tropica]
MAHEWEHFVRDCPWVEGGPADWVARFEAALAPAFDRGRGGAARGGTAGRPDRFIHPRKPHRNTDISDLSHKSDIAP